MEEKIKRKNEEGVVGFKKKRILERKEWVGESTANEYSKLYEFGHDMSIPSTSSTILAHLIRMMPITEPSLGRAQEMNRYLDREGLFSVG